jgi:hypothetical protein
MYFRFLNIVPNLLVAQFWCFTVNRSANTGEFYDYTGEKFLLGFSYLNPLTVKPGQTQKAKSFT